MLRITVAELELTARYEEDRASRTVAAPPATAARLAADPGLSETEILFPYRQTCFASTAGQLAGNDFATVVKGHEQLEEIGRRILRDGAQPIRFVED